ncbi:hypothetical protein D3C71_1928130 [compost metagenome]
MDWRRTLASKLSPPDLKPPTLRMRYIANAVSGMLLGNWSVSQPHCMSPRFMSIEPKMPRSMAVAISCSKLWPDSVAWLASMLTLTSFSSP